MDESPEDVVAQNPDFFADFSVVVASQTGAKTLAKLDAACRSHDIALVALNTHGLVGTVRLSKNEHRVLEAKPEVTDFDLRVNAPWPKLSGFAERFRGAENFKNLTDAQRARVPWCVTLINATETMRASRGETKEWFPKTSDEKREIRSEIRRIFAEADAEAFAETGDAGFPENATEAFSNARFCWKPPGTVPAGLLQTLADPKLDALTSEAEPFWFLLAGLRTFLASNLAARAAAETAGADPRRRQRVASPPPPDADFPGDLSRAVMPLEGSIPDMTSTTEWYVEVQKLYREKADQDADAVFSFARDAARAAGASEDAVTRADARFFCKHASHARVARWRTIAEELRFAGPVASSLARALSDDSDPNRRWCAMRYVVLRATDAFKEARGRYPGTPVGSVGDGSRASPREDGRDVPETAEMGAFGDPCDVQGDVLALRSIAETILNEIGNDPLAEGRAATSNAAAAEAMVVEAVRCAGGEPHAVAAVLGGIGAQEVIKLVTEQFVPCARTLVYDAAKAITSHVL